MRGSLCISRALVAAGILLGGVALGPSALVRVARAEPAQSPKVSAADKKLRDAYAEGERRFKGGDYAGALSSFKTANDLRPTPETQRYIGASADQQKQFVEAVEWYERFLASADAKKHRKLLDEVKARVEAIKATPATATVDSVPRAATVTVDDKPADRPTPAEVTLAAGRHVVKVTLDGYEPHAKEIELGYGQKIELRVELEKKKPDAPPPPPPPAPEPPPAAPPPPPPRVERRSVIPAYVTGGLAVAAAGVGTGMGIAVLGTRRDYQRNPTAQLADSGERQALLAELSFGVAITLGLTSAVLFLTGDETAPEAARAAPPSTAARSAPSKRSVVATPFVTSHGGGGGAVLRF